ncbi:SDR family oxidoreductase [Oricola nitratireducens]|uniref:SDR family oxidoreductase n=1 Tax=Oricola nitratireducens TaxID=2775868 RepID=UPI0018671AFE|nr:SDR family oxidoreductase [Oricola nitratireducens]
MSPSREKPSLALFDLTGKTALITGAAGGIGAVLARGLAGAGARIVLNGRRREKLEALAGELENDGFAAGILVFDVTDHEATRSAIDAYEAETGPIDILVNNAGIQIRGPLEDYDPADFERIMATNVTGVFNAAQACARHMIDRRAGKIVNIASVQTALARKGIAPYTATKGAVGNLTKGMATDWAQYGIQANAIAPGYFDTPLNKALVEDDAFSAWLAARTPAGRWGRLEELVGAAVFLASDASSFVNGHVLYVDGAMTVSL